jgi:hypothetical protein
MKSFKNLIREAKPFFVIGLSSKNFLGRKFEYTSDLNKAYAFDTFDDAIDYEERNGDKIVGLTDIFRVQGSQVTVVS